MKKLRESRLKLGEEDMTDLSRASITPPPQTEAKVSPGLQSLMFPGPNLSLWGGCHAIQIRHWERRSQVPSGVAMCHSGQEADSRKEKRGRDKSAVPCFPVCMVRQVPTPPCPNRGATALGSYLSSPRLAPIASFSLREKGACSLSGRPELCTADPNRGDNRAAPWLWRS